VIEPLHERKVVEWVRNRLKADWITLADIAIPFKYHNEISVVYDIMVPRFGYMELVRFSTDPIEDSTESASL
jgi:hypothetical protein